MQLCPGENIIISKRALEDENSELFGLSKPGLEEQAVLTGKLIVQSTEPGHYSVSLDDFCKENYNIPLKYILASEPSYKDLAYFTNKRLFWKSLDNPQEYWAWSTIKPGKIYIYNCPDTCKFTSQKIPIVPRAERIPISLHYINLLPENYIHNIVIPATNLRLREHDKLKPLVNYGEFLIWISILLLKLERIDEPICEFWGYLAVTMRPRDINMYMTMERFETLSKVLALADLSTCFSDNGIGNFERAFNKNLVAKIIPERYLIFHKKVVRNHDNVEQLGVLVDKATSSIIQVNFQPHKESNVDQMAFIEAQINTFKKITKPWHHTERIIISDCWNGTPHIPVFLKENGLYCIMQVYPPKTKHKDRKEYKHLATILKPGHENVALISKDPYWYIIQKSGKEDKLIIANCGITTNEIVEDVLNDPEIIYAENSFSEQSAQQITVFQEYDSVKDINVYIKEIINRLFYTKLLSTNSFTTHMAVFLEIAFYNLCCLQAIKTDLPISLYMNQRLSLSISLQDYAFDLRKGLANVSCYDEAFLEMSNILKMDDIDESISTFNPKYKREMLETMTEIIYINLSALSSEN